MTCEPLDVFGPPTARVRSTTLPPDEQPVAPPTAKVLVSTLALVHPAPLLGPRHTRQEVATTILVGSAGSSLNGVTQSPASPPRLPVEVMIGVALLNCW